MRKLLAVMLLMACSACARDVELATPDPARLKECPRNLPADPVMSPLANNIITLPDGRVVVLLSVVRERSKATADYIVTLRDGFRRCVSTVEYVEDWGTAANRK